MKKKVWSTAVGIILIISLVVTGCSSNNNGNAGSTNGENNSNGTNDAAPVNVSVFAHLPADNDFATNNFSKLLEEKFNISFKWTTVPFDGAAEKRQISISSGDYPDVFMLVPWVDKFSQTDLIRFGQQGVVVPLNDLIDQYGPNIKHALDSDPYYKAMNTAPDGNIYGLNQFNECYHCSYPNKMWINTTWLEKLKLDTPKTTEDFAKVLEAFKTQDPNGNGKQDEVPLSGSVETFGVRIIPFLMNGFIYDDDRTYLTLNNGKVDIAANKSEWKEGLQYIKSLYDKKLIDPGAFTQNAEAYKMIGENADAQLLGAGAGMHPAIFINTGEGNLYNKDYNPIAPLKGPYSEYANYAYPVDPGASFVITNKASKEAQIAAIKIIDYLFTQEGQMRGNFGEEGINWRKPTDGDIALEESVEPIFAMIPGKSGGEPLNNSWGPIAQYYQPKAFRDGQVQGTDPYLPSGFERRLQEATHLYDGKQPKEIFPIWAVWIDPASVDEMSMTQTNIKDYIDQSALQFITGNKSLDKDWDSYVKGLEDLNLSRYLEIMQKSYDDSVKQ
ncbi:extracellular solute-binding protein [Paenibacillus sp. YIM B09110]|uniref:extracellular solute-binding protein n=1 Tax=Paenibacillus sp. YIM B09110 TaxID=3126102 RepID=UPI00301E12CD